MSSTELEFTFSPQDLAEWEVIVDAVNDLFATIGTEDQDFDVSTDCSTGYTIDLTIRNYQRIGHQDVLKLAPIVREVLRQKTRYWCVRIHVHLPDEMPGRDERCIWLEIDRYRILPWRGKREIELFEDIKQLYERFWPS